MPRFDHLTGFQKIVTSAQVCGARVTFILKDVGEKMLNRYAHFFHTVCQKSVVAVTQRVVKIFNLEFARGRSLERTLFLL
jgi:hypothetical protein